MIVTGILTSLAVSCALAAYLFYAVVQVPSDIEQRDDVYWMFVKEKYSRALVSLYRYKNGVTAYYSKFSSCKTFLYMNCFCEQLIKQLVSKVQLMLNLASLALFGGCLV